MELQNMVKEALNALYHHPDDAVRVQADLWLQDIQRTLDAWQTLLKSFHKGPPKVRTQIGLSVAGLAVHAPSKDWGDGGNINWTRDEMNVHPECLPSFLELLRVLPKEVFNYKISVRPDRRRNFEDELASGLEIVLNVLTACLNINELTEEHS